jgi:hypothetical protein
MTQNKEYIFGLFGSIASREVFRAPAAKSTNLRLGFQFRNSNIVSIMSSPVELPKQVVMPENAFRSLMLQDDFSKEFRISFADYAKEVHFLCIDLLEERFVPVKIGNSYVTMSDSYNDASGIEGSPLVLSEDVDLWKEKCMQFIEMLKTHFTAKQIFLFSLYLNERYEAAGNPYYFPELQNIRKVNIMLRERYDFFRENFKGINSIGLGYGRPIAYTDKFHAYGCLPEHYNREVYQALARQLSQKVKSMSEICEISPPKKSEIRGIKQNQAVSKPVDSTALGDAYYYSRRYAVLRDWMYKKSLSRDIDRYLIEKGCRRVAIYGMGEIGWLFFWEMQRLGMEVVYAIDENKRRIFSEIPVFLPEDELPEVDAIVVCVPDALDEVVQVLRSDAQIISVEKLIYEA